MSSRKISLETVSLSSLSLLFVSFYFLGIVAKKVFLSTNDEFARLELSLVERALALGENPLLRRLAKTICFASNPATIISCLALAALLLPLAKKSVFALLMFVATCTVTINFFGQELFARFSPELLFFNIAHQSFPSAHASVSIAVCGLAAHLLAKKLPDKRRIIWGTTFILLVSIGISRLFLVVNWGTDILAGYALGSEILSIFFLLEEMF